MSYRLNNHEYLNMVLCYQDAGEILARAQELYEQRYGVLINPRTILGAVQRHRETGTFQPRIEAGRQRYPVRLEEDVMDFFGRHHMASTADAARAFCVSGFYVWKLLRREGFHPYHFKRVHELEIRDFETRMEFSRWMRRNLRYNVL